MSAIDILNKVRTRAEQAGFAQIVLMIDEELKVLKEEKEICICAAVLATDGKYYRGHRHSDCIRTICDRKMDDNGVLVDVKVAKGMSTNQGFITSRNRFVNRAEGAKLQNEAGIKSFRTGEPINDMLFSEDLY